MSSTIKTSQRTTASESLSSWEEDPLTHVLWVTLNFLQTLFSYAPEGTYRWLPDRKLSEIIITQENPVEAEVVNKRPTIVAVLGQAAFAGIGLDQLAAYNFKTGERKHTDIISGRVTLNCIARKLTPARKLAWLVARHCWIMRRLMLKQGFHDFGQRTMVLSATPPGALIQGAVEPESMNVPVVVAYHFQWQDVIRQTDLETVQEIETRVTSSCPQVIRPTQVAEGGSPGPGLRGTAVGARATGLVNLRHPSIRGRQLVDIVSTPLPDSQVCATDEDGNPAPLEIKVLT